MAEEIDIPSWVKGRQAKVEPAGPGLYRIRGPNLPEAIIGVRQTEDQNWQGFLRASVDGPEIAASGSRQSNSRDALYAAFEVYREHMIY